MNLAASWGGASLDYSRRYRLPESSLPWARQKGPRHLSVAFVSTFGWWWFAAAVARTLLQQKDVAPRNWGRQHLRHKRGPPRVASCCRTVKRQESLSQRILIEPGIVLEGSIHGISTVNRGDCLVQRQRIAKNTPVVPKQSPSWVAKEACCRTQSA
jgi:hypothetical protein